ncbi:MAG: F0F1 ATP synthase subunit A [Chloroflexi bacterium]|nr:F0F1 ATP synthase subunit A [Chloroflexota bacterium]
MRGNNLLVVLGVLLGAAGLCAAPVILLPQAGIPVVFPHVQVAAEPILLDPIFNIGSYEFYLVNSLPHALLATIVVIIMGVLAGSAARARLRQYEQNPKATDDDGQDVMVPKGFLNVFEAIVEALYNLVEQIVGPKWVNSVLPLVGTIFLFVLTINWMHFLPGVDSVGLLHCAKPGFKGFEAAEVGNSGVFYLGTDPGAGAFGAVGEGQRIGALGTDVEDNYKTICDDLHHAEVYGIHTEEEAIEDGLTYFPVSEEADAEGKFYVENLETGEQFEVFWTLAPFFRTASTDLNLTLALALVAMVAVQIYGVRELGFGYFSKFINIPALSHGLLGGVEFAVGFLEIISEFSKIISFALRLFGNLFAGTILLFVMMFLVPGLLPLPFFFLEVLIGFIQATVFAMLTLVLIAVAMVGHGDHDDEEHH